MPVATGIRVFQGPWRVSLIHLSLNLGTLCLAIGFLTYQPGFFLWASGLLAISFSVFLLSVIWRSEEHTSELQSRGHLVCRLLLEKKKRATAEEASGGA